VVRKEPRHISKLLFTKQPRAAWFELPGSLLDDDQSLRSWNRSREHAYLPALITNFKKRNCQMRIITLAALTIGLAGISACNNSPREQAADNVEANAENTADVIEANTENVADTLEANSQNAADAVRAAGDNTADQVRSAGENHADTVRNGGDADGNSAH
jgi:hypothetical protein